MAEAKAGYLYHGEELFPARRALEALKRMLVTAEGEPAAEERFDAASVSWRDILDHARNVPFFFSPWRLFVVEMSKAAEADLDKAEEAVLREFFAAPTPKTTLVVLYQGKLARTKGILKLFESLPGTVVRVEEMKPYKDRDLAGWIEESASKLGKRVAPDAAARLIEIVGNDLRLLDSELEKLATYVGEKKLIEHTDVQAVTDWVKAFDEWELTNMLEAGQAGRAILVLDKRLAEGIPAQLLMNNLASFFRDILLGRIGLAEGRERKLIFSEVRPQIKESWRNLYNEKFRNFFAVVDRLPAAELTRLLAALEEIDLLIKTSDTEAQPLLEAFLYDFGRTIARPSVTSRGRA
ncbi:MAG: DNA polymerase III subunit delta [Candidatus Aminicenantes bacterium]|nr:DNA polymerase III subunit delta [Candidatus Aminicenantes bacterium]